VKEQLMQQFAAAFGGLFNHVTAEDQKIAITKKRGS
jgi:hypothetical protein